MHAARIVSALALAALSTGCGAAAPASPSSNEAPASNAPTTTTEERLYRWLAGRYDSTKQAAADRAYFEISLTMCEVEAPNYGPRALYVEQARLGSAPYRQRLYVVEGVDGKPLEAVSRVFEFTNPRAMVGFCTGASRQLPAGVVAEEKRGCHVRLAWNEADKSFQGGTEGTACASSLNGATYASSIVSLDVDKLVSWDRGYDAQGAQVWGATKGGYVFDRLDGPAAL
jgi:CpeT protein